jgi:murein endopeptidase
VYARRGFHQLTSGPGFNVMKPARAWGRKHVLDHLRSTFAAYHARFPDKPPMYVHDVSRRWGGRLWPHRSHRRGTDVDIRVLLDPPSDKYRRASPRTLDLEATWFIVAKLLDTQDVVYIFLDYRLQRALYRYARDNGATEQQLAAFQYPRGRHKREGIIRHAKGHADHIHVRFKSVPTPLTVAMR